MENSIEKVEKVIDSLEEKVFEKVTPEKLPSFFDLLKTTFKIVLSNKLILFLYFFLPLLANAIVQYFGNLVFGRVFQSGSMALIASVGISLLLISFVISIFNAVVTYGAPLFLKKLEADASLKVEDAYKNILKFTLPIILTGILLAVFLFGGFVFFVIPGIIFSFASFYVFFSVVLREKKFIDAIVDSFVITKGRKLYIFVQILGFVVLLILAGILLALISTIVFAIIKPLLAIKGLQGIFVFGSLVVNQAISACIFVIVSVFSYEIYKNLIKHIPHVTESYLKRIKKMVVGFLVFGVLVILSVVTILVVYRDQIDQKIMEIKLEKEIKKQVEASLANPLK